MNRDQQDIREEIQRLRSLLEGKQAEYQIFGKTSVDAYADSRIREQIEDLENKLITV